MTYLHISSAISRKKKIDHISIEMYRFLFYKFGYSRHPRCIPVNYIAKAVSKKVGKSISYDQIRERMKRLVEIGMIEKWTVSDAPNHKKTYWRIKYPGDDEISSKKVKPPNSSS